MPPRGPFRYALSVRFPVTFALGPLTLSAHLLACALLRVQRTRSPDVLERDPRARGPSLREGPA